MTARTLVLARAVILNLDDGRSFDLVKGSNHNLPDEVFDHPYVASHVEEGLASIVEVSAPVPEEETEEDRQKEQDAARRVDAAAKAGAGVQPPRPQPQRPAAPAKK